MKRNFLLISLVMLLTGSGTIYAQGEAAVPFLLISPGARAGGMGEANVALVNDATATYWNPAGLAWVEQRNLTVMHSNWLPQFASDLFYDYIAYTQNVEDIGHLGISITYFNLGENSYTTDSPQVLDTFLSYEFAIGLTYATLITENLAGGVTFKFIRSALSPFGQGKEKGSGRAAAVAFDLGVQYRADRWVKGLILAANLANLGPKISYIDVAQADPIPTNIKMGFAYKFLDDSFNQLTFAYDVNKLLVTRDRAPFYEAIFKAWYDDRADQEWKKLVHSFGLEYWYGGFFALRVGYFYENKNYGNRHFPTFGAGIRYHIFVFDFGYIAGKAEDPLTNTVRFSLGFNF